MSAGGIDVFQLYPSSRVHAPPHVSDIAQIASQIELPGLPQVRLAAPAPAPAAASSPAPASVLLEESFSAVASTLVSAVESARHAVGSPSVVRRGSAAEFQTPEQAEKEWLRAVAQAKPAQEAAVIRTFLEATLRDATAPWGQLMQDFVRAKYKAKSAIRTQKQQQQQQQQQQPATIVDLLIDTPPPPQPQQSSSASSSTSISSNGKQFDIETAQTFVDDLVATIARRHRLLRASAARLAAVTAAVETVLYSQTQSLYAATFAERDDELTKKLAKLVTLSPAHLGIPQRFWLLSPDSPEPPYSAAIELLRSMPRLSTPAAQLRALVDTCAAIDNAVKQRAREENWASQGLDDRVTADLLLPLLTFVVIRARIPRIYSLSKYLEDFISESDEIHEQGYVLVTFQCILQHILVLSEDLQSLNVMSFSFNIAPI